MAGLTKATKKKTKNTDLAPILGLTAKSMLGNGKTATSTELEKWSMWTVAEKKASGKMARGQDG